MIEPQSLQLGASCWKRIGAPVLMFGASASFGGMMKPTTGVRSRAAAGDEEVADALWATLSMKEMSFGVGGARFDEGAPLRDGSSRRITPASAWLSRGRNLIAS